MTGAAIGVRPLWLGILGLLLGIDPALAAGWDLQVAPGAWSLEQFGADVAVLRSSPARPSSGSASLLLACSAEGRRIRVSLPTDVAGRKAGRGVGGSALIAASGSGQRRQGAVMRFTMADAGTLVASSSTATPDDPVTRLAAMLATGPHDLDLLVSWGASPVMLTRLEVYRLSMRGAAPDKGDADHFIAACRQTTPQRDR